VVTGQMIVDLVTIGLAVKVIVDAARRSRTSEPQTTDTPGRNQSQQGDSTRCQRGPIGGRNIVASSQGSLSGPA
jgi:hypothetical protein